MFTPADLVINDEGNPNINILIIARDAAYAKGACDVYGLNCDAPNVTVATKGSQLIGYPGGYYLDLGTDDWTVRMMFMILKSTGRVKPLLEQ